ncbi:HigA family addiction module antitoxin [Accumulibacter sp.]|uniref:HigA family addiction module antitoxin n=1 Tax=Accumulibacter sp. TaxID=2053492 RepID=UPI0035ADE733
MKKLSPIHPGEILLEDFMKPLELTQYRVAVDIGVAPLRINQIVHGKRAITADTALRLARYFGTTPGIWLRLQARYDLEIAQEKVGKSIRRQVKVLRRPSTAA